MREKFPGFKTCMAMMRKRDGQTREDGFHLLLPHASEYVHELIEEFRTEKDFGLRCWLLELIGTADSPETFDFLDEQLRGNNELFRNRAIAALKTIDTKDARRLLWQARSFMSDPPEQTEEF